MLPMEASRVQISHQKAWKEGAHSSHAERKRAANPNSTVSKNTLQEPKGKSRPLARSTLKG